MPLSIADRDMLARRRFMLMTLLGAGASGPLLAASPTTLPTPELEGTNADGQRLRGRQERSIGRAVPGQGSDRGLQLHR
jgi:hypothetical protein